MSLAFAGLTVLPQSGQSRIQRPYGRTQAKPVTRVIASGNGIRAGSDRISRSGECVLTVSDISAKALRYIKPGPHAVVFGEVTGDTLPDLYVTMDFEDTLADLFFRNDGLNYLHEEGVLLATFDEALRECAREVGVECVLTG